MAFYVWWTSFRAISYTLDHVDYYSNKYTGINKDEATRFKLAPTAVAGLVDHFLKLGNMKEVYKYCKDLLDLEKVWRNILR